MYKFKNKFIVFLLYIYISHTYSNNYSYITFDLKKFINYSLNYDEPAHLIQYDLYSYYYTYITFGFPKKNYLMQISLDEYEFDLTNYKCDINSNYTYNFFDPFLSTSSIVEISGINFTYYGVNNIYRITDHIKLYKNQTSELIFPKIIFLHNPRNYSIAKTRADFSPYTCFKTGLRLPLENLYLYEDYAINIIGQFYRKKIINSYEWFIEYNNESNAKLIIGVSPYEYDPKKYSYNNSKSIKGIYITGEFFYWNLEFTQIYFIVNNKREQFDYRKVSLEPSFNYIKAPYYYFQFINETLFAKLFSEKKCFIKDARKFNLYRIYYCQNNEEIKKELKDKFININLLHRFLEKEFVLDYNDLFLEKNNKIYFLIIYDNMIRTNWIFGKPFLKKYFFSFNYEEKILTHYETINNKAEKENNNENIKKIILIVVIVVLVIIFTLVGFYLAKYIYKYKKKKATELTEDIDDDNLTNEENKKNKKIVEPIFDNNDN